MTRRLFVTVMAAPYLVALAFLMRGFTIEQIAQSIGVACFLAWVPAMWLAYTHGLNLIGDKLVSAIIKRIRGDIDA